MTKALSIPQERRKRAYLTAEAERALIVRCQAGDERAREELLDAHYPLVVKNAKRFCRDRANPLFDDYIQEGNVGLVKAINGFDLEKGVRFATYARWWVDACSQEFMLKNWSIVRSAFLTSGRRKLMFYMTQKKIALWESGREQRSLYEVCLEISKFTGVPLKDVEIHWGRVRNGDLAMDAPIVTKRGVKMTVLDTFVDPAPLAEETVNEDYVHRRRREGIERAMGHLNDRQRVVIERRILTDDPTTLRVLGAELGVSRERIRQIEQKALELMTPHLEDLRELVDA